MTLTAQFREWLDAQNFAAAHDNEEQVQAKRLVKARERFLGTLTCGLTAANHIFRACGKPAISAETMQEKAEEMAQKEVALLYSNSPGTVHDLATDPRGNYAADTLLHVIRSHSNLLCERWQETHPLVANILLVGCGQHWQAVLKDKQDKWFVMEGQKRFAVQNVLQFLRNKLKHGAIYQFHDMASSQPPPDKDPHKRVFDAPPDTPDKQQRVEFCPGNPGFSLQIPNTTDTRQPPPPATTPPPRVPG